MLEWLKYFIIFDGINIKVMGVLIISIVIFILFLRAIGRSGVESRCGHDWRRHEIYNNVEVFRCDKCGGVRRLER